MNDEMSEMERNEGGDELGFADKYGNVGGLTTYTGDEQIRWLKSKSMKMTTLGFLTTTIADLTPILGTSRSGRANHRVCSWCKPRSDFLLMLNDKPIDLSAETGGN